VIALCDQATESCLAFPRDNENLQWECPNPLDAQGTEETLLDAFRNVRELLRKRIETWLPEARTTAG
jgi:arsenate reductase